MMGRSMQLGPLSRAKAWLMARAGRHPRIMGALAGALACALCALLLWFIVFSGMNGPVQFVYAGF